MNSKVSAQSQTQDQMRNLAQRAARANETVVRLKVELETAQEGLENVKREAREEYGTDNVDELREKYRKMQADNLQQMAAFELLVTEAEGVLAKIEEESRNNSSSKR